jgi:hypothetical protein
MDPKNTPDVPPAGQLPAAHTRTTVSVPETSRPAIIEHLGPNKVNRRPAAEADATTERNVDQKPDQTQQ